MSKSVQCKTAANRMRKEYGEHYCDLCRSCCNQQIKSKDEAKALICIAYDKETPWDGTERACGLFNIPFLGIRPRPMPLGEYYSIISRQPTPIENYTQASIFDDASYA